jgi:uncharacterized protein
LQWTWDDEKNRTNKRVHGLSFESAQYVFSDPLAVSRPDPYPHEARWQTIGLLGSMVIFVVHTEPGIDSELGVTPPGRIISARQATSHERRTYEEESF